MIHSYRYIGLHCLRLKPSCVRPTPRYSVHPHFGGSRCSPASVRTAYGPYKYTVKRAYKTASDKLWS